MGAQSKQRPGVEHVRPSAKYAAWFMLAGQEFVNKVVRLAIPYLVPFIAQEQAFTAAQTARLLTGFSLGYVTCQVPAGYISTVLGPKFVQLCNNIGLTLLFLGLPALAKLGSAAVFGAVLGVGVLQGPFMIAHHGMSYNWSPAEDSPERPWARFIMHLGNHLSKVVGPTLTPLLSARYGWQFVARMYGCGFAGFAVLWQLCTSSHPPPPPTEALEPEPEPELEPEPSSAGDVSMLTLLATPPQQSCMWIQVTHDLIEFQTLGSWAPLYLHEVLGVPLGSVGAYTIWPMAVGTIGKLAITGWESHCIKRGMDRLKLRKLSTAICSCCCFVFVPLFTLAPTPLLATLAYCGVSLGGCFEYPGFVANLMEVEGDDAMMLEAYSNPSAWFLVFLFGSLFPRLWAAAGGNWYVLFLGPLAVRLGAQVYYQKHASINTARSFHEAALAAAAAIKDP